MIEMAEVDECTRAIMKTCRVVMKSRKASYSDRIEAARILAACIGLYGPGRPKKSVTNDAKLLNVNRLDKILQGVQ